MKISYKKVFAGEGSQMKDSDARLWASELPQIAKKHKTPFESLNAEIIVQEASIPESKLHAYFEWNDMKAAHQHRLAQARFYVRHIVYRFQKGSEPVRLFSTIRMDTGEPGIRANYYVPTETAIENPQMREQILAQAYAEWMTFQRKYQTLKELADLFQSSEKIWNKIWMKAT